MSECREETELERFFRETDRTPLLPPGIAVRLMDETVERTAMMAEKGFALGAVFGELAGRCFLQDPIQYTRPVQSFSYDMATFAIALPRTELAPTLREMTPIPYPKDKK